ncbi:MAG TPA: hypothetical protein VGT01_10220 [Candidatus Dormibacteraeota bacterium]|nr:hypothetical protein [Candidatus Dormibacteraeota bacterium]
MFTVEYRTEVREALIEKAREDPRIESAAAVGGSAEGDGDRWSDLDLSFGVAGAARDNVLTDWTQDLRSHFDAVTLLDLPLLSSVYRVFLLPGSLQVDLSFTPTTDFGALGPRFKLLFGSAVQRKAPPPGSPRDEFGLGAHHAVRARYCIDRGRLWQAEHWTSLVRDHALMLACRRLGLEAAFGRGFDALPQEHLERAEAALIRSIDREDLLRALHQSTDLLLEESAVHEDAAKIETLLREVLE